MSHRLHVANLRTAAAREGDRSDYRIAQRAGITRATLSRLAKGHAEPSITTLIRLARCYGLTLESLVHEA